MKSFDGRGDFDPDAEGVDTPSQPIMKVPSVQSPEDLTDGHEPKEHPVG
jgi:hypothetical protein